MPFPPVNCPSKILSVLDYYDTHQLPLCRLPISHCPSPALSRPPPWPTATLSHQRLPSTPPGSAGPDPGSSPGSVAGDVPVSPSQSIPMISPSSPTTMQVGRAGGQGRGRLSDVDEALVQKPQRRPLVSGRLRRDIRKPQEQRCKDRVVQRPGERWRPCSSCLARR